MKRIKLKEMLSILLLSAIIIFIPALVTAGELVKIRDGKTNIHVSAKFQSVAYINIEHESFKIPQMDKSFWKSHNIVQDMLISIHGAQGETVSVSCAILNHNAVRSTNCTGEKQHHSKELLSGDSFKKTVNLTSDMVSKNGSAKKTISLQIAYI